MSQYSNDFRSVLSAEFLAKGGEAIVYRFEYVGSEEVVAKVPIFTKE